MRRVLLLALERVTCEALEVKRRDATRIGYRAKIDERVERRRSKILIIDVPCARGAHATARPRTLHAGRGSGRSSPKMTVTSQHFGHTRKHCEFVLDLASTSPVVCLPSSYPIRDPIRAPRGRFHDTRVGRFACSRRIQFDFCGPAARHQRRAAAPTRGACIGPPSMLDVPVHSPASVAAVTRLLTSAMRSATRLARAPRSGCSCSF